jgi:DNA repair exonuclease SbcCD ATPase subunit
MDGATTEQYDCERLITDIKNKIATYEKDNVQEKYAQLEKLEEERDLFQVEINNLKADVRIKLDKIEKLGNLTYNEDCDHCMSNPFTLDAMETKKTLEKDKELAGKYLTKKSRMDDKIQTMFKIRAFKKDLDDLGQSKVEGESRHTHLVSNLKYLQERNDNLENQLTLVTNEIQKSIDQQHDVVYNQGIGKQIEDLKSKKYLLDDDASDLSTHITTIHGNIQVLKTNEKQINDNIDKVEELEGDHQAYQYLLEAIKRDGVPYDLISKSLPTVEGAVNDILAQIVDFSIVFNMDGKQIDTHIVYDDDRIWPLELSSGMERFISSLAIRIGLMNVSNLPQSNFLAIDEGWGTMDSENLNSVSQLFQYLKTQFQFTFVVSHIETMRDFVDTLLEIKKTNGSSSVRFTR